jgi:Flp pilus assembly pilin Flp
MFPRKYERGQGLVEYAMLLTLVAMIVLGLLVILGVSIGDAYINIVDNLPFS